MERGRSGARADSGDSNCQLLMPVYMLRANTTQKNTRCLFSERYLQMHVPSPASERSIRALGGELRIIWDLIPAVRAYEHLANQGRKKLEGWVGMKPPFPTSPPTPPHQEGARGSGTLPTQDHPYQLPTRLKENATTQVAQVSKTDTEEGEERKWPGTGQRQESYI